MWLSHALTMTVNARLSFSKTLLRMPLAIITSVITWGLLGCSSIFVVPHNYPPGTNSDDVIRQISIQIQDAKNNQVDVFSPQHFKSASDSLEIAKEKWYNHESREPLDELGYAKGNIDAAINEAERGKVLLSGVAQVRQAAIIAGARTLEASSLVKIDQDLESYCKILENGSMKISPKDLRRLQQKYLNLELQTIIESKLGSSQAIIDDAVIHEQAYLWASKTLIQTEADLKAAKTAIEADPHNEDAIRVVVANAQSSTSRLLRISKIANEIHRAHGSKPEAVEVAAIKIDDRQQRLATHSRENVDSDIKDNPNEIMIQRSSAEYPQEKQK